MTESSTAKTKRPRPLVLDVHVPAESQGYPVLVGRGAISRIGTELLQRLGHTATVALVSDTTVAPLHGATVQANLEAQGFTVVPIVIPSGESHKNTAVLLEVLGAMITGGMGRRDAVVALGGGVVGDLSGLAAALFMRGIPVIQCPTTLLSQVDASVGGKVAVDVPAGKNMVGAFHFPLFVLIDPEVLSTLGDRELAQGLAEMLKHALLFAPEHLSALLDAAPAIYARNFDVLGPLIATSVGLKAACVGRDPWETGEAGKGRVLLNLGHTFGHAIESASDYSLPHGEAVALGLRAAARISEVKGIAEPGLEALVVDALTRLRLPTDLDPWLTGERGEAVEQALIVDKKRSLGTVSYVALARVGEASVVSLSTRDLLKLLRREPIPAE